MKFIKDYVYVVLEHDTMHAEYKNDKIKMKGSSAVLHGVYINKEEAQGKRNKLIEKGSKGYVAVLKKPVLGKAYKIWY